MSFKEPIHILSKLGGLALCTYLHTIEITEVFGPVRYHLAMMAFHVLANGVRPKKESFMREALVFLYDFVFLTSTALLFFLDLKTSIYLRMAIIIMLLGLHVFEMVIIHHDNEKGSMAVNGILTLNRTSGMSLMVLIYVYLFPEFRSTAIAMTIYLLWGSINSPHLIHAAFLFINYLVMIHFMLNCKSCTQVIS